MAEIFNVAAEGGFYVALGCAMLRRTASWCADDVPEPVAVDEAVELAKQLSTDDSPGFVYGVLGQIMLVTPQIRAAAEAVRGAPEGS